MSDKNENKISFFINLKILNKNIEQKKRFLDLFFEIFVNHFSKYRFFSLKKIKLFLEFCF
jgi:hypothetical protein